MRYLPLTLTAMVVVAAGHVLSVPRCTRGWRQQHARTK